MRSVLSVVKFNGSGYEATVESSETRGNGNARKREREREREREKERERDGENERAKKGASFACFLYFLWNE